MSAQRTKFTSPFAPLSLSETDVNTLDQLSRVLLSNYVTQYEQYVLDSGRDGVNERVWRPIKQRENVRVFAQRKHQSDGGGIDEIRESIDSFADSGVVQPAELPVILAVGSIAGVLDDVMYGLMCPTTEAMRVKTSYLDDRFSDAAVLHTIASPTEDDPFQSFVIKWAQAKQNIVLRAVTHLRDFVYMERTGIAYTATSERLGFHMLHSVHFPQTDERLPIVRGNISVCGIFRGDTERSQVDVFVRGIADLRGSVHASLVTIAAADMFIPVAKYVECSYHKKLAWRLRMKQKQLFSGLDILGSCVTCERSPSKVTSAVSNLQKRKCAVCVQYVCSSCRLKKTLSQVDLPTDKLWRRAFAVCPTCYDEVRRSNAFAIAQQELALSDVTEGLMALSSVASSSVCSPTASDISSIF